jgi:hypothetical protein
VQAHSARGGGLLREHVCVSDVTRQHSAAAQAAQAALQRHTRTRLHAASEHGAPRGACNGVAPADAATAAATRRATRGGACTAGGAAHGASARMAAAVYYSCARTYAAP